MAVAESQRHLARNTLIVGASFGLAAATGLLRNMIIARRFGIGADLDTYYAAFKLPELLFTVVAGGALSTALIPILVSYLAEGDRRGAWRLASAVTNLVLLALAALAVGMALLAPWLVRAVIAPGFTPEAQAETAIIMRLVLLSTLIFGISSVQTAVLHSMKHFLFPALAPVLYPLGVAAGAWWLAPRWGVRGLAFGAILGALLHLLVKAPALWRYGFRWWPVLDLRAPRVRRVFLLMAPRVLDLGVFHLTLLATTNLASRLGAGSLSALEWGWDFMQLPETVIGTAFGMVALPTLADLAARGNLGALRDTLAETLQAVLALTVPAALGLILLGRPLLQVLYQRGAFDAAATDAVYVAVRFYALGLVGHSCLELAARAFFAQEDMVTPLVIAAGSAATNIVLGVLLMGPLGHGGLALANSLAISAEVIVLMLVLRKRWTGVAGRQILAALGRVLIASLAMGAVVVGLLAVGRNAGLSPVLLVATGASGGFLAYGVAALLLRLKALRWPLEAVRWK